MIFNMENHIRYVRSNPPSIRIATRVSDDTEWGILTGERGGSFKRYKTIEGMDKAMVNRGYTRKEIIANDMP